MTIQDLHVGDKILVDCQVGNELVELEVLDIRGGYAKFVSMNGYITWTRDISAWTLIEKLVDGKKSVKYKAELYLAILDGLHQLAPNNNPLGWAKSCGEEQRPD